MCNSQRAAGLLRIWTLCKSLVWVAGQSSQRHNWHYTCRCSVVERPFLPGDAGLCAAPCGRGGGSTPQTFILNNSCGVTHTHRLERLGVHAPCGPPTWDGWLTSSPGTVQHGQAVLLPPTPHPAATPPPPPLRYTHTHTHRVTHTQTDTHTHTHTHTLLIWTISRPHQPTSGPAPRLCFQCTSVL